MKNTIPKYPIVIVCWDDFFLFYGWKDAVEIEEIVSYPSSDFLHETVGFLVDKDSERVVLATSVAPDGAMSELIRIPASQVRSLKILRGLPKGGDA